MNIHNLQQICIDCILHSGHDVKFKSPDGRSAEHVHFISSRTPWEVLRATTERRPQGEQEAQPSAAGRAWADGAGFAGARKSA